jgi:hypothetical protein
MCVVARALERFEPDSSRMIVCRKSSEGEYILGIFL